MSQRSLRRSPVVALDFDGVLNIFPKGTPPAGFTAHTFTVAAGQWPTSPFLRDLPDDQRDVTVTMNPAMHGQWIRDLQTAGVTVVWATTWQEAAVEFINPILGADIPVAVSTVTDPPRWDELSNQIAWKANILLRQFKGRPICFIDDQSAHTHWVDAAHWLAVAPSEHRGLTRKEMATVDQWAAKHQAAGQP